MDRNTLFDSLVAWVNTFDLNFKCKTANDFKDGLAIAKCLNNIDPVFFNDDWVNKIKAETNDNWRLKLLNLKKVLQTITDYYSEVLNHSLTDFEMPKLNLIADANDTAESIVELSLLLQLVLGCAVNCERKSEFIKKIMDMNETAQEMIMNAIQDLMSEELSGEILRTNAMASSNSGVGSGVEDISVQLKKAMNDIHRLNEQKEEFDSKCKRLDKQIATMQDEKLNLLNEIEMLKQRLLNHDQSNRTESLNNDQKLKLQQRVDQMQEELYKLESEKEKYRVQFEAAQAEQNQLIEKNIELKKIAQDAQLLKDEIDVLKHTSDKVEKLESTIEMYKIKLEEMADLKKQMKQLEENNAGYLEQIVQMEKEVKKINTFKSQIEMYKKQIQELHEQVLNGEMKMKTLEYEYKGAEETCNSLKQEKSRIQNEYERLREQYDALQTTSEHAARLHNASQQQQDLLQSSDSADHADDNDPSSPGGFSNVELCNVPNETKEKIIRLYHENKMLKAKQSDLNDERLALLQTQYEDERQRNADLQAKLNQTSRQKIELECQFNELKKKAEPDDQQLTELKSKLNRLQVAADEEKKKTDAIIKQHLAKIDLLNLENEKLVQIAAKDKDELVSKDKEIQELTNMNDKYKLYLDKAKYVITNLTPDCTAEVQQFRQQLAEKDKTIKHLMREIEKIQSERELEERLIASSWYQLGADLNRRATDERINSMGSSFLAQQRHLSTASSSSSSSAMPITAASSSKRNNNNHHHNNSATSSSLTTSPIIHNNNNNNNNNNNHHHYNNNHSNNHPLVYQK